MKVYIYLIEALYTLNSPPVVSLNNNCNRIFLKDLSEISMAPYIKIEGLGLGLRAQWFRVESLLQGLVYKLLRLLVLLTPFCLSCRRGLRITQRFCVSDRLFSFACVRLSCHCFLIPGPSKYPQIGGIWSQMKGI